MSCPLKQSHVSSALKVIDMGCRANSMILMFAVRDSRLPWTSRGQHRLTAGVRPNRAEGG